MQRAALTMNAPRRRNVAQATDVEHRQSIASPLSF
jgi:hypothetical protein